MVGCSPVVGSLVLCSGAALPLPAPVSAPAPQLVCPPFRAWSDADLKALGQTLAPIPENSLIMRMALDWRRYYGDAKACATK